MVEQVDTQILPLKPERWHDFEELFGDHGAFAGCWCTFWRIKRSDYMKATGEERKAIMQNLVNGGTVPGVMLYEQGQPVGWCSLGPRSELLPLERSRTIRRIDDQPVWSIVCFFIKKGYRRKGAMQALIKGAIDYAKGQGAKLVEAYPLDMQSEKLSGKKLTGYSGFMGIASAFKSVGFKEVGRVSEGQLIVRYDCAA